MYKETYANLDLCMFISRSAFAAVLVAVLYIDIRRSCSYDNVRILALRSSVRDISSYKIVKYAPIKQDPFTHYSLTQHSQQTLDNPLAVLLLQPLQRQPFIVGEAMSDQLRVDVL